MAPPSPPPPPPPPLMEELVEECLLRLPPDDPASIVRAAVVCKGWRRIVTDRGFRRRFRDLHGRPPMQGFLHIHTRYLSFLTPTSSSWPRDVSAYLRYGGWHAIDCRHGRVLLSRSPSLRGTRHGLRRCDLAVWDPVSGDQMDLPQPPPPPHPVWSSFTSKAAVLCASSSAACDHLDCRHGQFLVVLLDTAYHEVRVYVYSSQAGAWSHQTTAAHEHNSVDLLHRQPVTGAGNVLYFSFHKFATNGILKYDMGVNEVSWVDLPSDCSRLTCPILLTTTEYGGLGIARVEMNSRLHLWSGEAGPDGVLGWEPSGVIELENVLPANSGAISTIAFVHDLGAFFIKTNAGAFTVDLVSSRVRKVCGNNRLNYLVPYTSCCTPALGAAFTGEGPIAGVPST